MESKRRTRVTVPLDAEEIDGVRVSELVAKLDPLDPRILAIARIVARQAIRDYLDAAANDNDRPEPDGDEPP